MTVKYFFSCSKCGEYLVTVRTFKKFIVKDKWKKLQKKINDGAFGGAVKFGKKCPKCSPEKGFTKVTLKVLWPKRPYK